MPRAEAASGLRVSDAFPQSARNTGTQVALQAFDYLVTIERDQDNRTDEWGQPARAEWRPIARDVPCLMYTPSLGSPGKQMSGESSDNTSIEERHLLLPPDTDINVSDRVSSVTRADTGAVVYDGPMLVAQPPAHRASFIDVVVKRIA